MTEKQRQDAAYFLKRLNDLPGKVLRAAQELKSETVSRRILTMSLKELCEKALLDTDEASYSADPKHGYAAVSRYLDHFGMRTVPCSIPIDLQFSDLIFVTSKPNLSSDEDIAAVSYIVKSGRAPRREDYRHIQAMNAKMTNYNIMLRLFEALFVICPGQLSAQQLSVLNSLLNELRLPLGGINYLRACLTYASQQRSPRCDYSDPSCVFKPLDAEKTRTLCGYLAKIAAAVSFRTPFDSSFPYLKTLEQEFEREEGEAAAERAAEEARRRAEEERRPDPLTQHVMAIQNSQQIPSVPATAYPQQSSWAVPEYETPRRQHPAAFQSNADPLYDKYLDALRENLKIRSDLKEALISAYEGSRDKCRDSMPDFGSLALASCKEAVRPAAFAVCGRLRSYTGMWPWLANCAGADLGYFFKTPACQKLKTYLLLPDERVGNAALRERRRMLCWNFLMALVAVPLFTDGQLRTGPDTAALVKMLHEEFERSVSSPSGPCGALAAILALRRTLFEGPDDADPLCVMGYVINPVILQLRLLCADKEQNGGSVLLNADPFGKKLLLLYEALNASPRLRRALLQAPGPASPGFIHWALNRLKGLEEDAFELMPGDAAPAEQASFGTDFRSALSQHFTKPLAAGLLNLRTLIKTAGVFVRARPEAIKKAAWVLSLRQDEILWFSRNGADLTNEVSLVLSGCASHGQLTALERSLAGFSYTREEELLERMGAQYKGAEGLGGALLRRCGILCAPMREGMPRALADLFPQTVLIPCGARLASDERFVRGLSTAQTALALFMSACPSSRPAPALAGALGFDDEGREAAASFLKSLEDRAHSMQMPGTALASRVYRAHNGSPAWPVLVGLLKKLARLRLAHSEMAMFDRPRIAALFKALHIADAAAQLSAGPEFKGFENMDQALIASKISESREIEGVIAKLRDDGERAEGAAPQQPEKAKESPRSAKAESGKTELRIPGLSAQASQLVAAAAAEGRESMDLEEFDGLCRSLRFMSGDAAIEELNDFCCDHCDEPLFEAAPEEGCVYITVDLAHRLAQGLQG